MKEETKYRVWLSILQNPNLNTSQLAEKNKVQLATISEQLSVLEKDKMAKFEFKQEGRGIEKIWFASFEYFYEELSRLTRKSLSKSDYEKIDKFWRHPSVTHTLQEFFEKEFKLDKGIDPTILISYLLMKIIPYFEKTFSETEDEGLLKLAEDFITINKKLQA